MRGLIKLLPFLPIAVFAAQAAHSEEHRSGALLLILGVAVLVPFINELPLPLRLPGVVLETAFGIIIGPHVLGWVQPTEELRAFGDAGMAMLFFIAGMELEFDKIRGRPLGLGIAGWISSVAISTSVMWLLHLAGLVIDPILMGLAITTTAMGTLLPILKDSGDIDRPFGRYVLGAASVGEFGPVLLISIIAAREGLREQRAMLLLGFLVIAVVSGFIATRMRTPWFFGWLEKKLYSSNQLPVRIAMLLLLILVTLSGTFGLDVVLGAFAAGMVVRLVSHGEHGEMLIHKLDGIGFGFLIPIFFVMSGVKFDLPAAFGSVTGVVRVLIITALLYAARGVPCLLFYKRDLTDNERKALSFYASAQFPLLVAFAELGVHTGRMRPEGAASLIAAGMLSLLLFPARALAYRKQLA